jgi:quinol monooxygenase YgiN
MFVPPSRRGEVVEMLRLVQGRLEITPDCLGCWLQEGEYPSPHVLYAEQWKSEEAFEEHVRSAVYRRILAAMELSTKAPEVGFHSVATTRGMEWLQTLRGQPHSAEVQT